MERFTRSVSVTLGHSRCECVRVGIPYAVRFRMRGDFVHVGMLCACDDSVFRHIVKNQDLTAISCIYRVL